MEWLNNLFTGGLDPEMLKRMTPEQREAAKRAGFMDAGMAMLAGSGWSNTPQSMGQGLAQGAFAGRAGFAGSMDQSFANQQRIAQEEEARQAKLAEAQQAQAYQQYLQSLPPEQQRMFQAFGMGKGRDVLAEQAKEAAKPPKLSAEAQKAVDMGLPLGTPENRAMVRMLSTQSKAPVVNVNTGGYSPFDKALATKDAETFTGYRDQAQAAGTALENLDVLKQINGLQQGGKVGEAMAVVGQYFGSDAAANMQTFQAVQSQMVLKTAESLKGAMSDRDIQLLEETLPQFGNDPRANKIILDVLERAGQKAIANYNTADAHVQKTGNLRGFKPTLSLGGGPISANAAKIDLDSLNADDLEAELRRRRGGR